MGIDWGSVIIQVAVLLFALSFHEMAHAWSANKLGDPTARDLGRLTMNPIAHIDPIMTILFPAILYFTTGMMFGAAKPVPVDTANLKHPKRDHMWIAAAGPISNVILAGVGIIAINLAGFRLAVWTEMGSEGAFAGLQMLYYWIGINMILAAFNLLPIHPLDGSWILSRFLSGRAAQAYASLRPYGFIILLVLLYTGVLWSMINPIIGLARYFLPDLS